MNAGRTDAETRTTRDARVGDVPVVCNRLHRRGGVFLLRFVCSFHGGRMERAAQQP